MSAEMLDAVDQVFANANRLVSGVNQSQWEAPTPCSEWNVRQLVNHMAGTTQLFAGSALRTPPTGAPDADHLGDDPAGSYAKYSAATAAAWRTEGALDGMTVVPADMPAIAALGVNIIDIGTHCWDLATATGQEHGLSPELVALIDDWNRRVVTEDIRAGGGFGAILPGADDDGLAGMLAYVGRAA